MSQWHYCVAKYTLRDLEDTNDLNVLGADGWELVCLKRLAKNELGTPIQWLAVFKKQPSKVQDIIAEERLT